MVVVWLGVVGVQVETNWTFYLCCPFVNCVITAVAHQNLYVSMCWQHQCLRGTQVMQAGSVKFGAFLYLTNHDKPVSWFPLDVG